MLNIYTLLSSFADFLQYIVLGMFVLLLFNKKIIWIKLGLFSLINTTVYLLTNLFLPRTAYSEMIYIAIFFITMILLLKFILNLRFSYALLGSGTVFLLSAIVQYLAMAILKVSLQGFDLFAWAAASPLNTFMIRSLGTFLDVLAVLSIYYLRIKIHLPADIYKKRKISIILNTFIIILIIVPDILFFETTVIKIPNGLIVFNGVSVLVLFVLSTYNSIKFGELEKTKKELEFQKLYNKTLDDLTNNLRGFKHEFNNIISCIDGYLFVNDIEGLKGYFLQINNEVRNMNNIEPLNSFVRGNPAIYGLLLSKISFAQVKNINFNVRVMAKLEPIHINLLDFCKVIGILLDNALEAACDSENKYVEFMVREDSSGWLVIEVSNSFFGNPDIEKMFDKGFTTKGEHKGFGLWELKRIVSKNHTHVKLTTSVSGNLFFQNLKIC